jgi:hypothetical protein
MLAVLALQQSPVIVTLVDKPSDQTSFADVIIGAFGITGVLLLVAIALGLIVAFGLVKWHQRHRPEEDHLPPVTS